MRYANLEHPASKEELAHNPSHKALYVMGVFNPSALSFTGELLVAAVPAFIATAALVYVGVRSFNQEAKDKGLSEKGYTLGSVLAGALLGFGLLFFTIYYELFWKSRYGR